MYVGVLGEGGGGCFPRTEFSTCFTAATKRRSNTFVCVCIFHVGMFEVCVAGERGGTGAWIVDGTAANA